MPKKTDIKKILTLDNTDMIEKIEAEIAKSKFRAPENPVGFEYAEVDKALLFTDRAVWLLYNRETRMCCAISGQLAECYLAKRPEVKSSVVIGLCDRFVAGNYYLKFLWCR